MPILFLLLGARAIYVPTFQTARNLQDEFIGLKNKTAPVVYHCPCFSAPRRDYRHTEINPFKSCLIKNFIEQKLPSQ